jgi:hypothetical protein
MHLFHLEIIFFCLLYHIFYQNLLNPLHNQILFNPKKVKVSSKEQKINQEVNSVKKILVNDSKIGVGKINEKELPESGHKDK